MKKPARTPSSGTAPYSLQWVRRRYFSNAGLAKQVAQPGTPAAIERVADQRPEIAGQRLAALEQHVADEAVADDDVDIVGEDVAAFDVADEVEPGLLEHLERLARQLRALALPPCRPTSGRPVGVAVPSTSWA